MLYSSDAPTEVATIYAPPWECGVKNLSIPGWASDVVLPSGILVRNTHLWAFVNQISGYFTLSRCRQHIVRVPECTLLHTLYSVCTITGCVLHD